LKNRRKKLYEKVKEKERGYPIFLESMKNYFHEIRELKNGNNSANQLSLNTMCGNGSFENGSPDLVIIKESRS